MLSAIQAAKTYWEHNEKQRNQNNVKEVSAEEDDQHPFSIDFLPGRRERRECAPPGTQADSGPGKERKKSLPGRVSFNCSSERAAGSAKSSLLGCLHGSVFGEVTTPAPAQAQAEQPSCPVSISAVWVMSSTHWESQLGLSSAPARCGHLEGVSDPLQDPGSNKSEFVLDGKALDQERP